jgi:hypothetical protein
MAGLFTPQIPLTLYREQVTGLWPRIMIDGSACTGGRRRSPPDEDVPAARQCRFWLKRRLSQPSPNG